MNDEENGPNRFEDLEDRLNRNVTGSSRPYWLIIGGLIAIVAIVVIILLIRGGGGTTPELTPLSATVESTNTSTPPTDTPVPPTDTPEPTATPVLPTATSEPTATPVLPTATSEPTATPVSPTATPEPSLVIEGGGTDNLNAALYMCANVDSQQIGVYVDIGDSVDELLGRSANGSWIYVEHDGAEGWVSASARFVTVISGSISTDLDVIDQEDTVCEDTSTSTPNRETINSIAYWNASATSTPLGNGFWDTEFTVRVSTGGHYSFQVEELQTTWRLQRSENGDDFYIVSVKGMSCDGPLNRNFTVLRNGQKLQLQQEGGGLQGDAIYIAAPSC